MASIILACAIIFQCSLLPSFFLLVDAQQWPKIGSSLDRYTPIFNPVVKMGKGRWQLTFTAKAHSHVVQMYEVASHAEPGSGWLSFGGPGTTLFNAKITTTNSRFVVRNGIGAGVFEADGSFAGQILVFDAKAYNTAGKDGEIESWFFDLPPLEFVNKTGITTVKTIFYTSNDYGFHGDAIEIDEEAKSLEQDMQMRAESDEEYRGKICSMKIIVDDLLWKVFLKENEGYEKEATEQIKAKFFKYIASVNTFFWASKFGKISELAFTMDAIEIMKQKMDGILEYPIRPPVQKNHLQIVLEDFAKLNLGNNYCLALLFTFRPNVATHGYSYTNAMCHRGRKRHDTNSNVAVINLANGHSIAEDFEAQHYIKHELGHTIGASEKHDDQCIPGRRFLMNSSDMFLDPDDEDREKFSECSIKEITNFLEKILKIPKGQINKDGLTNCLE